MGMRSYLSASWPLRSVLHRPVNGALDRRGQKRVSAAARAAIEPLEGRLMMTTVTAALTPPGTVTSPSATNEKIVVTYTDSGVNPIDETTLATTNISISGPHALLVSGETPDNTNASPTHAVTYTVSAPGPAGSTFSNLDNGMYTIGLASQVADTSGSSSAVAANANFGSFTVNVPASSSGPTATLTSAPNITTAGGTTQSVVVTYVDNSAPVFGSSLAPGNITVKGPAPGNATLTVTGITPATNANAATEVVTYTVQAPGNVAWSAADNGTYTIGLTNTVSDTSSNTTTANPNFGTFTVNIGGGVDGPPTAALTSAPNITTAGGTTENVVVTYTDTDGTPVLGTSLVAGNLTVTGPAPGNAPLTVTAITPATNANAPTEVVTYTVQAPGGTPWSAADNGSYTIGLANTVSDTASHTTPANASFGNFAVNIGGPDLAPTATLTSAPNVTAAGGTTESVVVTYVDTDGTPVKGSSIAINNITVTSPTSTALTVTAVTPAVSTNGPTEVVTYTVRAPGGLPWSAADSGTYTIGLAATVMDTNNQAVTANPAFGTFQVSLVDAPQATLTSAPPITTRNVASENIVVTYRDPGPALVSLASIGTGNLTVTSTAGTLNVQSVTTTQQADAATIVATYTVAAPNGVSFGPADTGTYTIGLNGNVTNTASNSVTANPAFGTFGVNIAFVSRPTGVLTPTVPVTTSGVQTEPVIVTFTDELNPISVASLVPTNITVTGPTGARLTVQSVNVDVPTDGSPRVVTYNVQAPNGAAFLAADNGTYTIGLNATVLDTVGATSVPNPAFGTFTVTVPDVTPPVANTVFSEDIKFSTGPTHPVVVIYSDDQGIDLTSISTTNITVTGPGGVQLPVISATPSPTVSPTPTTVLVTYSVETTDGTPFSAANNGTYTIGIAGAPDGVADTSGNFILANPHAALFTVAIPTSQRPVATITAAAVATEGQPTETVTVVLTDPTKIKTSSITLNSLSVLGANGERLAPQSLTLSNTFDAPTVTATYVFAAPNLGFTTNDNSTYTATLSNVVDVGNLPVDQSSATTTFAVAVPSDPGITFALGQAGLVGRHVHKLKFHDIPDGTYGVLTISGGTGTLYQEGGSNQLDLVLDDNGKGLVVTATTIGGGPLTFKDIIVHGNIKSFSMPTANITGTFYEAGTLKKALFRHLVGVFAVTGSINSLTVSSAVTNATILSGVNFGADQHLGGGDDSYGPGFIGTVKIGGSIENSVIAAGDNPGIDGFFGTNDDVRAGTIASTIQSITAAGADYTSRIVAGAFGKYKFGRTRFFPNPKTDPRFFQL